MLLLLFQCFLVLFGIRLVSHVCADVEQDGEDDTNKKKVAIDNQSQCRRPQCIGIDVYIDALGLYLIVTILYLIIIDESVPVDQPDNLEKEDPHAVENFKLYVRHGGVLRAAPDADESQCSYDVQECDIIVDG